MAPGKVLLFGLLLALAGGGARAQEQKFAPDRYHTPAEVAARLQAQAAAHPGLARLLEIGRSAGGDALFVMQLAAAPAGKPDPAKRPAILLCANVEGAHLIGTEAALALIDRLLTTYEIDSKVRGLLESRTVFVAPLLNPDAAKAYFAKPCRERLTNDAPLDDDLDTLVNEDGPDDLNRDGLITQMRVKDPEGTWIIDPKEPRLMRPADPAKGEVGVYKLYSEGIDNDGDGEINEDSPGGVELNRNFPHDFENNNAVAGRWPVSQPETIALAKFMFEHPTIALTLHFSTENTLAGAAPSGAASTPQLSAPAASTGMTRGRGRSGGSGGSARRGGGAPASAPAPSSAPSAAPAASGISPQDKPLFDAAQQEFADALKAANLTYPAKKARPWGKGSLAAWCYFQYGVPSLSCDIWAVPDGGAATANAATSATRTAAGKGAPRTDKSAPAPRNASAPTSATRAAASTAEGPEGDLLRWSDSALGGKGFVPWKPFQHPTLGMVEIGGFAPYAKLLPPPNRMEKPVRFASEFYLTQMLATASLEIRDIKVEALDGNLYSITCFVANPGKLPTATAQGARTQNAWPVTVRLKTAANQAIFSGRPLEKIPALAGHGGKAKLEWTIRGPKGSTVTIDAGSPKVGAASAEVTLRGEGDRQ